MEIAQDNPFRDLLSHLDKATSRTKAYGAPRVFDLFTLLAITLAFAVLFALLGLLAPAFDASASNLTLAISSFVSLIAISQMWLFGSTNPRLASILSGPIAMAIVVFFWLGITRNWYESFFFTIFFAIITGSFFGYLGGAVVAGVFLLADKFRSKFMTGGGVQRDATFDELQ